MILAVGCSTTSGNNRMTQEEIDRDHRILMQQDQMQSIHNRLMFAHSSTDDEDYELWEVIEYDEDPRTGICFAFYNGAPFAVVQCGYARDAIPKYIK